MRTYKGKRYFVRIIYNDGKCSILKNLDKTEFCKQTANKHANDVWNIHRD